MLFFFKIHIVTLCIAISLCATVALVCLFSPKVYIILLHPEKNTRLTKRLSIHSNNLQFASQIAKTPDLTVNHRLLSYDISSSGTQSKSLVSNDNEENCRPSVRKLTVVFQSTYNNHKDRCGVMNKKVKSQPNFVTFVETKMKSDSHNDDDSLDSNFIQNEEIVL